MSYYSFRLHSAGRHLIKAVSVVLFALAMGLASCYDFNWDSVDKASVTIEPFLPGLRILKDSRIMPITFTKTPKEATGTFSISPDLPDGLSIDGDSGEITGTPETLKKPQSTPFALPALEITARPVKPFALGYLITPRQTEHSLKPLLQRN